jgi:glutamate--cysteine ligase
LAHHITSRLGALSTQRLLGMQRGIEKESLRVSTGGSYAMTPHPRALGSALAHPHITTDFSESQLELVTGVHPSVPEALAELRDVHRFVYQHIGPELMWVSSMPGALPPDAQIPLGQYGTSNVGQSKTIYRRGLANRYGPRMQTISGIHYNWSFPGVSSDEYFGLIRNFRRHSFLLLMLFGASPAVNADFVAGLDHGLQPLGDAKTADTFYLPHATSLRMGRLGYQSDAQTSLSVSYNCLDSYGHSLQGALTQPYPEYAAIGIKANNGVYQQLNTSLLQIENEFYGTIRPKRVIFPGERPLHALRERGVEYVEVRCMDLNPFLPEGIDADTAHFLDTFLLHCLLSDSPPDTLQEVAELSRNQHLTASRGREPGLQLERRGANIGLTDWALEVLEGCRPIAEKLDAVQGFESTTGPHQRAWQLAWDALHDTSRLPSARVLAAMQNEHANSHVGFALAQSLHTREAMLAQPLSAEQQADMQREAAESLAEQGRIEAADTMPFEIYRQTYLDVRRLGLPSKRECA